MIEENSGKLFRFKMDFELGYGFAEVYDFTDVRPFDGVYVFVYDQIDQELKRTYSLEQVTSRGIALGPISLFKYPNSRGIGSWKSISKSNNYILTELPITKYCQELAPWTLDWSKLNRWCKSPHNLKEPTIYLPYDDVRHLETRILNSNIGVVKKATMKKLIDDGKNVADYYSFSELGNLNMFVQLVNTYYPQEKVDRLITELPKDKVAKAFTGA